MRLFFGFSHFGSVEDSAERTIELDDSEAEQLSDLIDKHHGKVTQDEIRSELPEIYDLLLEESSRLTYNWFAIEAYESGDYEEDNYPELGSPEYSLSDDDSVAELVDRFDIELGDGSPAEFSCEITKENIK